MEIASGRIQTVAATAAAEDSPLYSPDGRSIAYRVSDIPPRWGIDFRVYIVPTFGGPAHPLAETFNREPALVGWMADSRGLIVEEARGTSQALYRLPLDGSPVVLFAPDRDSFPGVILNSSRNMFGFARQGSAEAPEAFVSPIDPVAPRRVSHVNADLPKSALGQTKVIRWSGPGELSDRGLTDTSRRLPGRPAISASGDHARRTAHGVCADIYWQRVTLSRCRFRGARLCRAASDIRGSTGYGKDFRYKNYDDWGGKDFEDMMSGVDHLVADGIADPERLGVMGWSYGGYMTAWTVTQTKRFKAASIGAPITDLASLNGIADMSAFVPDYFGGEAWEKTELYIQRSPLPGEGRFDAGTASARGGPSRFVPFLRARSFMTRSSNGECRCV